MDSLPNGSYYLEAYTRNSFFADSTEMTAVRKVKILQSINQIEKVVPAEKDSSFRFEIFPEGGNLVAGISSKLAFKATNAHGYPVEVKGTLYEDDTPLTEFQSAHAGMGFIRFTPLPDKTYQIRLANGNSYPLPEIYPQGMTLQFSGQDSAYLEFTISQNEKEKQSFYLMGQLRGIVYCVAKGTVLKNQKVRIPLNEITGQGTTVFTLYNGNMKPVSERLVYIHSEKRLYITAEPDKKSYVAREKATIKIKVIDEKGNRYRRILVSVFLTRYTKIMTIRLIFRTPDMV
jgi:hypothetical protein